MSSEKLFFDWWNSKVIERSRHVPFTMSGMQRLYRNVGFQLPLPFLGNIGSLEDIGYTSAKMRQLERSYLRQLDVAKAIAELESRIERRKWGSVTISHHGEPKKNVPSDFCMVATTVAYVPRDGLYFDTVWRSMEAIKRGRADFVFLDQHIYSPIVDVLDSDVREINFRMHSLTVHPMFYILLCNEPRWRLSLMRILIEDKRFARDILKWFWYYLVDPDRTIERYSSGHQVLKIVERMFPPQRIDELRRFTEDHYDKERRCVYIKATPKRTKKSGATSKKWGSKSGRKPGKTRKPTKRTRRTNSRTTATSSPN